jgi:hypothetical protein
MLMWSAVIGLLSRIDVSDMGIDKRLWILVVGMLNRQAY